MLKIYICGPTVYNDPHIGNLRAITTFDLVLKANRFLGQKFKLVHNITDIDDKIINKSIELKVTEKEISEKYTKQYFELLKQLNIDTITDVEKVTDNIDVIIEYINKLVNLNQAYKGSNSDIWFNVKNNEKQYGSVSGQILENMEFDEKSNDKKFNADFALWKSTSKGIQYNSPFGLGRPGWHTECCALIDKHFGKDGVDVHGGGMDLTFPHHENENIQHFALHNQNITKEWIRCGQINLDGVKMSKSLGNIIYPQDFFNKHGVEIYKLLILTAKLSAPINMSDELIENLKNIEQKYKKTMFSIFVNHGTNLVGFENNKEIKEIFEALSKYDFAKYNLLLNEQIKNYNKTKEIQYAWNIHKILSIIHPTLTDVKNYNEFIQIHSKWIELVKNKNFEQADILRKKLQDSGLY